MPQSNQGDWEVIGEELSTLPSFGKAPALKAVSPVATGKLASKAKSDWEIVGEEPLPPGFFERFSQSYGIPTTKSELKEALKQHVVGTILGPAHQMPVQALSYAQTVSGGLKTAYQEAKEAGENIGAGLPPLPQMGKVAYGTTQAALKAIPFIGGTISTAGEDWAKRNYWGAIGGLTGVVSQLAFLKSKDIKSTPPEIKGYYHTIRALTGTKPDFPEHVERLVARGHLREFATKFKPQTVRKGEASLREYMNQWEGVTINPAIARHPSATISGDLIAADIQTLKNPALDALFPENTPVIDAEMTRYQGKTVLLSDVAGPTGLLAKLNAMSKTLQAMSPENKAAAEHANVARAVVDKVTTAVRNQLYGTLESLGETGIREAQRDYGSMRELQEAFRRNIPKAERAEAIKPTYKGIPGRAIQRHPLLTGGFILGGIAMPHAWPAMGALPVIEAITSFKERAAVPNVQLRKAMEAFAKGPKRAPLPAGVAKVTAPTRLPAIPEAAKAEVISPRRITENEVSRELFGRSYDSLPEFLTGTGIDQPTVAEVVRKRMTGLARSSTQAEWDKMFPPRPPTDIEHFAEGGRTVDPWGIKDITPTAPQGVTPTGAPALTEGLPEIPPHKPTVLETQLQERSRLLAAKRFLSSGGTSKLSPETLAWVKKQGWDFEHPEAMAVIGENIRTRLAKLEKRAEPPSIPGKKPRGKTKK